MLPLGFTSLADSPTIVLSPYQHQFDPITSRASHTYSVRLPKPIMPSKPWDKPLNPTVGSSSSKAQKRSRDSEDGDMVDRPDVDVDMNRSLVRPAMSPLASPAVGSTNVEAMDLRATHGTQAASLVQSKQEMESKLADALKPLENKQQQTQAESSVKKTRPDTVEETILAKAPLDPHASQGYPFSHLNFSIHIGVGWRGSGPDKDAQAAWRGQSKAIEMGKVMPGAMIIAMNDGQGLAVVQDNMGFHLVEIDGLYKDFLGVLPETAVDKAMHAIARYNEFKAKENTPANPAGSTGNGHTEMDLD